MRPPLPRPKRLRRPRLPDVAPDAYYAGAVAWAVDQGITAGKTQTLFAPNETCTTAQILTFLWRANGSPEPAADNPFTDVEEDAYYSKAARWAYEKELVSGNVFSSGCALYPGTDGAVFVFAGGLSGCSAENFLRCGAGFCVFPGHFLGGGPGNHHGKDRGYVCTGRTVHPGTCCDVFVPGHGLSAEFDPKSQGGG